MPVIYDRIKLCENRNFLYQQTKFTYDELVEYLMLEGYSTKHAKEILNELENVTDLVTIKNLGNSPMGEDQNDIKIVKNG